MEPTEKQLEFAQKIADDFDVDVDDEVEAWMKLPDPCEE